MNLVGTLAKMAVGVMVTRGVGKMIGGGSSGGGLGGLLGGLAGGAARSGGGGLAGMLGNALGGGGAGGGLGGLLNSLGGGQQGGGAQGGIGGMLGQMMGGDTSAQPSAQQNTEAEILIRAMINSAKSDGGVDESEQRKILEHLGEVSQDEIDFVQNEMAQPLDVDAFIRSVPQELAQQVYVMSLLGIDLDSKAEAQYLNQLSTGLGISNDLANQIHEKVGVPSLYS